MTRVPVPLSIVLLFGMGCVSSQQVTEPDESVVDPPTVSRIDLTRTWGEVGRPFKAELRLTGNIRDREYAVSRLPEGLRFDPMSRSISGVPEETGFYTVSVAVRRKIEDRPLRYTRPSDRWFSEDFELRIYNRISD